MSNLNKINQYDLHPTKIIPGYEKQAWEGLENVKAQLLEDIQSVLKNEKRVVICLDFYPGVDKEDILKLANSINPVRVFDMEDYAKTEEKLNHELYDYMTDDRVFGIMCHKNLEDFFEADKMLEAKNELEQMASGIIVIAGVGAGLLSRGDIYVYCNLTRWETQLRFRAGKPNWHCSNNDVPTLEKYKRGFFIEWRLADRYKKKRYNDFDYMLDSEEKGNPKLVTGDAFRAGLDQTSREPFRMEPYFDSGVWGGHWMQDKFGLDPKQENFAWSFDGVPEENSLNFKYGDVTIKTPAMDLILYRPVELLGDRVHGRFGAEFPIRFNLLDTMGGGKLSLQVHPLTDYIQDTFGMNYTQDESYYILDTDESTETYVYLGVKKDIDKEEMERELRLAEKGEIQFPATKYVNEIPIKKHDHVLIPSGTIHCSGENVMVLEISATPFIFTFKLWDWGRVGLDGIPRPIHIDHGLKNVQWDRDTDWVHENLLGQEKTIESGEGYDVEKTGLYDRTFFDTHRYNLTQPYTVETDDSVHVMNLVDGNYAFIESTDGSFERFKINYAETAIVPAKTESYRIVPGDGEVKLIVASVRR